MARTRAQRRRQTVLLTCALALTLLVLLFARDVNRSAHQSTSSRMSENQTFAVLANTLIGQENSFAFHLRQLVGTSPVLTRSLFDARLVQLNGQVALWQNEANLLARPNLAHDINKTLADMTEQEVDDYTTVLAHLAASVQLPWTPPTSQTVHLDASQSALVASPLSDLQRIVTEWNDTERFALVKEPGRVHLDALWTSVATDAELSVSQVNSLQPTRGVGLGAVEVLPTPLPATSGELLIVPTSRLQVNVSAENPNFINQPVTFTISLRPTNGRGQAYGERMVGVIGPDGAYAFTPKGIPVVTGEKATLAITLSGAPQALDYSRGRTYKVVISPSGQ